MSWQPVDTPARRAMRKSSSKESTRLKEGGGEAGGAAGGEQKVGGALGGEPAATGDDEPTAGAAEIREPDDAGIVAVVVGLAASIESQLAVARGC